MINFIRGDLIKMVKDDKLDAVCHQCNCVTGGNVAGFANILCNNFPEVRTTLEGVTNTHNLFGTCVNTMAPVNDNIVIIGNLFAQYYPGESLLSSDSFDVRLKKLEQSFMSFLEMCNSFNIKEIGCPLLASGIGKSMNSNLSDLEYFKKYIFPTIENLYNWVETNKNFKFNLNIVYL